MISTLLLSALLGALLGASPASACGPPVPTPALSVSKGDPEIEQVRFETSDGKALFGELHAPRRPQERATAVLLIHGAGGSRADLEALAASLAKRNFAVLRFDLRGHGQSATEDLDWSTLDEEQRLEAWTFTTRDVKSAAAWLLAKDGVHSSALHLVGVGEGAALVTRHATKDRKVQSATLIEPLVDPLGFEFEEDLAELEGLPLQISVPRKQQSDLDELLERTEMTDAVTTYASKVSAGDLLTDVRCTKAVGCFIEETLEPKVRGTNAPKR